MDQINSQIDGEQVEGVSISTTITAYSALHLNLPLQLTNCNHSARDFNEKRIFLLLRISYSIKTNINFAPFTNISYVNGWSSVSFPALVTFQFLFSWQ